MPNNHFTTATDSFADARQRRHQQLRTWAASWRKSDIPIPNNTVGLQQVGGGMRDVFTTVWLPSTVREDGARIYGVPIQEAVQGLKAVEILPLLLLGQFLGEAELRQLLREYYLIAVETGAYKRAAAALNAIKDQNLDPMQGLNVVLSFLPPQNDTWRDTAMLCGIMPYVIAALCCIAEGRDIPPVPEDLDSGLAEVFVDALGSVPDRTTAVAVLDRYLSLHSTHSVNLGSKGAQTAASGKGSILQTVTVGATLLATPAHGGAQGLVTGMLLEMLSKQGLSLGQLPSEEQLTDWAVKRLQSGKLIFGNGHAVIEKVHDPRSVAFRKLGESLPSVADDPLFRLVCHVMDLLPGVLGGQAVQSIKQITNWYTDIDFCAGPLLKLVLGLNNPAVFVLLFFFGRFADYMVAKHHLEALGLPIDRSDSLDAAAIDKLVADAAK